jgi:Fe-S cluster assembly scaffold protein SufB
LAGHGSFISEALEQFRKLPEERNELYKGHFVSLPLAEMAEKIDDKRMKSRAQKTNKMVTKICEGLQTRFDAIVWSDGNIVSEFGDGRRMLSVEEIDGRSPRSRMFRSDEDRLVAFVHAYAKRIVRIRIPDSAIAKLNLLFLNTDRPLPLRVLVDVGEDSSLELLEYYASETKGASLLGSLHEIRMAEHSNAEVNIVHNEDRNTIGIGLARAEVLDSSSLRMNFMYNGGSATRSKSVVDASGHSAKAEINELVVGSGEQRFDITTNVVNSARGSSALLESRAVLMDSSTCLLKGSAEITREASGSESGVNERGMILDGGARMDSIPSMRINNNDVKASHSSATAPIDEEELFYLMSRGASELLAKKMVVNGFLSSGIVRLNDIAAREIVASIINERMTTKSFGTVPRITTESMWLANSGYSKVID